MELNNIKKLSIIALLALPLFVSAQYTVPQGGTGKTSFPLGGWLYSDSSLRLNASSSPTVGSITATSSATSTFPNLSVTGTFNLLGTYVTNVSTWFSGLFNTNFAAKSTTDLQEGDNLYYTEERVSANVDVAANTAARHNAVTLAGTPDYITLAGQVITRGLIDLTTDVTGVLPDGSFAKTGDWTGTFDGEQGPHYLDRANHTGTQLANTISNFSATARGLFTGGDGLTYDSGTGDFDCDTASGSVFGCITSTDWNTFNNKESVLSFTYPLQRVTNAISLAFGTSTTNSWTHQIFSSLFATNASSTNATTTTLTSLGNTLLATNSGQVGISTTSPQAMLAVSGANASAGNNATTALAVYGGTGGDTTGSTAKTGGDIKLFGGRGGADGSGTGGDGGSINLQGGPGGSGFLGSGNRGTVSINASGGDITLGSATSNISAPGTLTAGAFVGGTFSGDGASLTNIPASAITAGTFGSGNYVFSNKVTAPYASSTAASAGTYCLDTCITAWPTGGGSAYPFTPTSNFNTIMSATSTPLWARAGLFASTTSRLDYASTTALTYADYIGNSAVPGQFIGTDGSTRLRLGSNSLITFNIGATSPGAVGTEELALNSTSLFPSTDLGLDLGIADIRRWKNAYFTYASTTNITSALASTTNSIISSLTSGRIPFATTGGRLVDSGSLTISGDLITLGNPSAEVVIGTDGSGNASITGSANTVLTISSGANYIGYGGASSATYPHEFFGAASFDSGIYTPTVYGPDTLQLFAGSGFIGYGGSSGFNYAHEFYNGYVYSDYGFVGDGSNLSNIPASSITAGTFGSGNYVFSNKVTIPYASTTALSSGNGWFTGQVGIGTTTPMSALSIVGTSSLPPSSGVIPTSLLDLRGATANTLYMGTYSVTPWGAWIQVSDNRNLGTVSYPLALQPVGGGVGIGTTTPTSKLHVLQAAGYAGDIQTWSTLSEPGKYTLSLSSVVNSGSNVAWYQTYRNNNVNYTGLSYSGAGAAGVGTTSPNWAWQVAGTRPSLALTDLSAGANLKHWLLSSMGGNLYIGTSTDRFSTSTSPVLSLSNTGLVGIGSTTPFAKLAVNPVAGDANQFVVGSSTATSFIIKNNGFTGIGTSTPAATLGISSPTASTVPSGVAGINAVTALAVYGGNGGAAGDTTAGTGGDIRLFGGRGGTSNAFIGGNGGPIVLQGGPGGAGGFGTGDRGIVTVNASGGNITLGNSNSQITATGILNYPVDAGTPVCIDGSGILGYDAGAMAYPCTAAASPFFTMYLDGEVVEDIEFSANLNTKEKANWQSFELKNWNAGDYHIQLENRKAETDYIDSVEVILYGSWDDQKQGTLSYYKLDVTPTDNITGHKEHEYSRYMIWEKAKGSFIGKMFGLRDTSLNKKDGKNLVLEQGEGRTLKIEKLPDGFTVYSATLRTYGYYEPYKKK